MDLSIYAGPSLRYSVDIRKRRPVSTLNQRGTVGSSIGQDSGTPMGSERFDGGTARACFAGIKFEILDGMRRPGDQYALKFKPACCAWAS